MATTLGRLIKSVHEHILRSGRLHVTLDRSHVASEIDRDSRTETYATAAHIISENTRNPLRHPDSNLRSASSVTLQRMAGAYQGRNVEARFGELAKKSEMLRSVVARYYLNTRENDNARSRGRHTLQELLERERIYDTKADLSGPEFAGRLNRTRARTLDVVLRQRKLMRIITWDRKLV